MNNSTPTSERTGHLLRLASSLLDQARPHLSCQPGDEKILRAAIKLHQRPSNQKRGFKGFSRNERKRLTTLLRHRDGNAKPVDITESSSHQEGDSLARLLGCYRLVLALDQTQTGTTKIEQIRANSRSLHIKIKGPHAYCDLIPGQAQSQWLSSAIQQPIFVACDQPVSPDQLTHLSVDSKSIGITPDDPISEAGKKVLRFHFARMLHYEPGTRVGEDSEALHKMRVATRRMRAAFGVFNPYFDEETTRGFRQTLQDTASALGEVRDLDVFRIKLERDLDRLPTGKQLNLDAILSLWREEMQQARAALLQFLDGDVYQRFVQQFNDFLNHPGEGVAVSDSLLPVPHKIRHLLPTVIYARMGPVQAYEGVLGQARLEQQHKLRIKVKRLRYALEFMSDILGEEQKKVLDVLKRMQDHLGDLNDTKEAGIILETWLERLNNQTTPLSDETRDAEAIDAYLAMKQEEQDRLRASFPQVWRPFDCPTFQKNLAKAIFAL